MTWLCAQATVGTEAKIGNALARIGVESYVPLTRTRIHDCNHHTYHRVSAHFPGYLFVRPDESGFTRLKTGDCSIRLRWVDFGYGPVPVSQDFIDLMRSQQNKDGYVQTEEEPEHGGSGFKSGQRLQIISGIASGTTGLFVRDAGERVIMLLSMLGRSVETPIQRDLVARLYQ
jgi:transcription antitermination factor NusG